MLCTGVYIQKKTQGSLRETQRIDLTFTPHRPLIDLTSTWHRLNIDPTSNSHRPNIDLAFYNTYRVCTKTTRYTKMYRCKCHLRVRKTYVVWMSLWLQLKRLVIFTWVGRVKTRANVYTRKCIHLCTNNFSTCFHKRRMYAQSSGLNGPYEQMSMSSWAVMSMTMHVLIYTLMQDEQMSICSWAVMSMSSYAHRTKLFPTWFWKCKKIYT
jgi:hypothetical protein